MAIGQLPAACQRKSYRASLIKKIMALWGDEEALKLIEVWGEDNIQAQLEGCKRNAKVFAKIVSEIKDAGYERTRDQCRYKIKKLKGEYRKINMVKREGRKRWKFFEALHSILVHRPATCPPHIIDTFAVCQT